MKKRPTSLKGDTIPYLSRDTKKSRSISEIDTQQNNLTNDPENTAENILNTNTVQNIQSKLVQSNSEVQIADKSARSILLNTIDTIPRKITNYLLTFFDRKSLGRFASTSKKCRNIVRDILYEEFKIIMSLSKHELKNIEYFLFQRIHSLDWLLTINLPEAQFSLEKENYRFIILYKNSSPISDEAMQIIQRFIQRSIDKLKEKSQKIKFSIESNNIIGKYTLKVEFTPPASKELLRIYFGDNYIPIVTRIIDMIDSYPEAIKFIKNNKHEYGIGAIDSIINRKRCGGDFFIRIKFVIAIQMILSNVGVNIQSFDVQSEKWSVRNVPLFSVSPQFEALLTIQQSVLTLEDGHLKLLATLLSCVFNTNISFLPYNKFWISDVEKNHVLRTIDTVLQNGTPLILKGNMKQEEAERYITENSLLGLIQLGTTNDVFFWLSKREPTGAVITHKKIHTKLEMQEACDLLLIEHIIQKSAYYKGKQTREEAEQYLSTNQTKIGIFRIGSKGNYVTTYRYHDGSIRHSEILKPRLASALEEQFKKESTEIRAISQQLYI